MIGVHVIEGYGELIDDLASINGLGESNVDLIEFVIEDVNTLIRAGLYYVSLEEIENNSAAVKYIIDNISRNGEELTENAGIVAAIVAARLMCSILSCLMAMSDEFFAMQISLEETEIAERNHSEFMCITRVAAYQEYKIEEDQQVDPARLVTAIFKMYSMYSAKHAGVRREIQGILRAH